MALKKIIQIEMNELSKDILERFCTAIPDSAIARVLNKWHYTQTTSENEYKLVEPWIQWVTAHTGKTYSEHGVLHLGDAVHLKHDQIWEELSDRGIESAIVGCMNATRGRTKGGVFVPDPWARNPEVYPQKLENLWKFISSNVQKHATESRNFLDFFSGAMSSLNFDIPLSLYMSIASQIIRQKLDPQKRWQLAGLFDEFLFTIFENILKETNFRYNVVFLNAIAHYQHHYWREYDPDIFSPEIHSPDCGRNDNPILVGLRSYDRILQKVLSYAENQDTLVIIATGLSQVPFLAEEAKGGMHYYRLKDHFKFVDALNISGSTNIEVFPLMSRDWQVASTSEETLKVAREKLTQLHVENEPLFIVQQNSKNSLFLETAITSPTKLNRAIHDGSRNIGTFGEWFSSIAVKSGCHTGIGHVWCSQPLLKPVEPLTELCHLTKKALLA